MFLLDFYLKFFLTLFLDYKIEKKKVFNQSIANGEWYEEDMNYMIGASIIKVKQLKNAQICV